MLETRDLILGKARFEDWEPMYRNVWRHPESAKYMFWTVTGTEDEARERMRRTIEWQKSHDSFQVYEKAAGEAIGFAGVLSLGGGVYDDTGICVGPRFTRRGYGRQIVQCLMDFCKNERGAKKFCVSAREGNIASNALIRSMGFSFDGAEQRLDERTGITYTVLEYSMELK